MFQWRSFEKGLSDLLQENAFKYLCSHREDSGLHSSSMNSSSGEGGGGDDCIGTNGQKSSEPESPRCDSERAGGVGISSGRPGFWGPDGGVLVYVSSVLAGVAVNDAAVLLPVSLGIDIRSRALLSGALVSDCLLGTPG